MKITKEVQAKILIDGFDFGIEYAYKHEFEVGMIVVGTQTDVEVTNISIVLPDNKNVFIGAFHGEELKELTRALWSIYAECKIKGLEYHVIGFGSGGKPLICTAGGGPGGDASDEGSKGWAWEVAGVKYSGGNKEE